jgi:predicted transglutaminase-like cysteine proteinase
MIRRAFANSARSLAAALMLIGLSGAAATVGTAKPLAVPETASLFGARAIHYADISDFQRWTGLLARWESEQAAARTCGQDNDAPTCAPREWTALIAKLRGLAPRRQIEAVNAAINAHPYVAATTNWHDPAHWETPFEFMRRNGQCQDYAIAKFLALRALGFADAQLRLVVLRDMRRKIDHAVLVVDWAGEALLLDNLLDRAVPASRVADYRAYYSLTERSWSLYLPNPLMPDMPPAQLASR